MSVQSDSRCRNLLNMNKVTKQGDVDVPQTVNPVSGNGFSSAPQT